MIELDELTFVQSFWIIFVPLMVIFLGCNWLNVVWVFQPLT